MACSDTSRTSPCRIREGGGHCRTTNRHSNSPHHLAIAERKNIAWTAAPVSPGRKNRTFVLLVNPMPRASPIGLLPTDASSGAFFGAD